MASKSLPALLCLLMLLASLASSTPVAAPRPAQTQDAPGQGLTWEVEGDAPGTIACEIDRTSDYYGLGVRMGVFAAWMTSWIANVAVQDEISGALDTNAIFLFALVIAIVRCTITNLVSRIDGLMLMHLSLGTVFAKVRTCRLGGAEGGRNCAYNSSQVNSGIRIASLVLFVACMGYYGVMVLASVLGPLMRLFKMRFLLRHHFFRTSSRLRYATGLTYGQLKMSFWVSSTFNLFWVIFTIVSCEYTLMYNHIQSVLGENGRIFFPSQLIPFAIGICGLIRVLYLFFEDWRSVDHSPSLGHTPSMPKRVLTMPRGKDLLEILAPATQPQEGTVPAEVVKHKRPHFEENELDEEIVGKPLWWGLMVSYLPWLQPVAMW
ncbi:uncharacterized protein PV09_08301 [Verruconis gallopava]|uniref:Uncharacterized protein n=1 Tax=Verruconis gallopava TaxID=253628 RepID=A0A0D2ALX0_9PEZI|nr:uncharacterized protein PV09_08301 [Verruconis gallopava]KIW00119.1 hypothetical protein PV09_08301 [Verruconis gallopava]